MCITIEKKDDLQYLVSSNIGTPHGFTTRLGGVSTGAQASLNLALNERDTMEHVEQNITRLSQAVGFDPDNLVLTRQIHSDLVRTVTMEDRRGLCHRDYPECDGLVTNQPGLALMVFTADCTPLLLWDPVTGAVGAAHAGWRGTAQNIAGKTVAAMVTSFGCDPQNIHAAIGPNIGPCHFETNEDVPQALEETFGPEVWKHIRRDGEKFFPDLKVINALALGRAGLQDIAISSHCTYCSHQLFWSHRYTAGNRGAQGAVIVCKEVTL